MRPLALLGILDPHPAGVGLDQAADDGQPRPVPLAEGPPVTSSGARSSLHTERSAPQASQTQGANPLTGQRVSWHIPN